MRCLAIAVSLFCCAISHETVYAQSFWYVPQGYEYGNYYGLSGGNGVGFGYGIGIGIPITPEQLTTQSTSDALQPASGPGSGETEASTTSGGLPASPLPVKKKPAKASVPKKHGSSTQNAKAGQ
jgi:hypothetical protein